MIDPMPSSARQRKANIFRINNYVPVRGGGGGRARTEYKENLAKEKRRRRVMY